MKPLERLAEVPLFAAFLAVLGLVPAIPIPILPVPITAQTLGVMLAGSVLGPKRGAGALCLFLLLVAAGLPVLAGGRGGLHVFFGPTSGYLLSWPIAAACVGLLVHRRLGPPGFLRALLAHVLGGILVVHAIGIPVLAGIAGLSLGKAAMASLLFVPGDLIKAFLATWMLREIVRAMPDRFDNA